MALKPTVREVFNFRNFIKEAINLKGYDLTYYSLDKQKTQNNSEFSSVYNESPQVHHYYTKYLIRGFIKATTAYKLHQKYGIEYVQQDPKTMIEASIYYATPQEKWPENMGKDKLLESSFEEDSIFLKIIPKEGDYIQYGIDNTQYFEVTSVYPFGWDFLRTYNLVMMQRPYIKSEEDLSNYIIGQPSDDPNTVNDEKNTESWFK